MVNRTENAGMAQGDTTKAVVLTQSACGEERQTAPLWQGCYCLWARGGSQAHAPSPLQADGNQPSSHAALYTKEALQ
jgi:hypothetical protein